MFKKYLSKIVQGVIYVGNTLLALFGFFELGRKSQIFITIVCALGYAGFCIVDILREKKEKGDTVRLKEDSDAFFNFFQKWYSQQGTSCIFCTNLDWMKNKKHDLISTICEKGSDCTIYLLKPISQPDLQRRLESAGVKIVIVDPHISTSRRFSLVEYDGFTSLIIRNKKMESNLVEFKKADSTNDPYLINLAKDLLEFLNKKHD
jgi:hypothetical protein